MEIGLLLTSFFDGLASSPFNFLPLLAKIADGVRAVGDDKARFKTGLPHALRGLGSKPDPVPKARQLISLNPPDRAFPFPVLLQHWVRCCATITRVSISNIVYSVTVFARPVIHYFPKLTR